MGVYIDTVRGAVTLRLRRRFKGVIDWKSECRGFDVAFAETKRSILINLKLKSETVKPYSLVLAAEARSSDGHSESLGRRSERSSDAFNAKVRRQYNNNNAGVFILRRLHLNDNERVITTL